MPETFYRLILFENRCKKFGAAPALVAALPIPGLRDAVL
jgi:hypothetical protein